MVEYSPTFRFVGEISKLVGKYTVRPMDRMGFDIGKSNNFGILVNVES